MVRRSNDDDGDGDVGDGYDVGDDVGDGCEVVWGR